MKSASPPFILLLGAKSILHPLPAIPQELSELKELFLNHKKNLFDFELDYEPYLTKRQLKAKLLQMTEHIVILHFAGHSGSTGLVTDTGAVYSHHIANIIKKWQCPPALIFLNGCNNAEQVEFFHKAGVPLVIATQRAVDDEQAAEFASVFYSVLFSGRGKTSVKAAFEQAGEQALLAEPREVRSIDLKTLASDANALWDWGLFPAETKNSNWHIYDFLLHTQQPIRAEERVFLSYSDSDKEAAKQLRGALKEAGYKKIIDSESELLHTGENRLQRLKNAIEGCSVFLLLVGIEGVQHQSWLGAEVEAALGREQSPLYKRDRLPIYPVLLPEAISDNLPAFLQTLIHKFQTAAWDSQSDSLPVALLEALKIKTSPHEPLLVGEPYKGLSYFQEQDAKQFFGRDNEVFEALKRFGYVEASQPSFDIPLDKTHYYRWLQIYASSGAGKSSLVRAGLLPKIRQGLLWRRTGYGDWLILEPMMPGEFPVTEISKKLINAFPGEHERLKECLNMLHDPAKPDALLHTIKKMMLGGQAVLLVIDQFEELFTQSDNLQRQHFDRLLETALAAPDCPFFLISTIRSDFLDKFDSLPELTKSYNKLRSDYFLPAVSELGLRELIVKPAQLADPTMSVSNDLVEAIVKDATGEPGSLPLIESMLSKLWQDARSENRKELSKAYYIKHGGVVGMLAAQADILIKGLGNRKRKQALNLLLALTRINEGGRNTRKRLSRAKAVHEAGGGCEGEQIIQILAGEGRKKGPLRLIVTDKSDEAIINGDKTDNDDKASYVELVHEMLVRARNHADGSDKIVGYWPTLYQYVDDNRDRDAQRQQLEMDAQRWDKRRWLGRLLGLTSLHNYRFFSKLRPLEKSVEGQYLRWSRASILAKGAVLTVLLFALGILGEAYLWTYKHELPVSSIVTLQKFRLGYKPLPKMEKITDLKNFMFGEEDENFIQQRHIPKERYANFGYPAQRHKALKPFAIGKYEVTYDEFDYFVWSQHRLDKIAIGYLASVQGNRGEHPAGYMTWNEANSYVQWLSKRRGIVCRLPTEQEWEYAAKAGTHTGYPWGSHHRDSKSGKTMANCPGCGNQQGRKRAVPVGQFEPNTFGLHDMNGNVWEMTFTPWEEESPNSESSRDLRVIRGGSFFDDPALARSTARINKEVEQRQSHVGFRVACELSGS